MKANFVKIAVLNLSLLSSCIIFSEKMSAPMPTDITVDRGSCCCSLANLIRLAQQNLACCEEVNNLLQQEIACCESVQQLLSRDTCDKNVVVINQSDLPYLISRPGRYCLSQTSTWAPTADGTCADPVAAITIASNNVDLNLNNYTLSQVIGGNGLPARSFAVGVKINSGLNNIRIHDGTIQNIGSVGIYGLVTPGSSLNNIIIENVRLLSCGTNSGVAGTFDNCESPAALNNAGGIVLAGSISGFPPIASSLVNNITLRNVTTRNCGQLDHASNAGASIAAANKVLVENCQFLDTGKDDATFVLNQAQGLNVYLVNDITVSNSNFLGVVGFGSFINGAIFELSSDITVTNCVASGVILRGIANGSAGVFNTVDATGFKFAENDRNVVVRNCTAESILCTATPSAGLVVNANGFETHLNNNILFENCVAQDVVQQSAGGSFGFLLGCNNGTFNNCVAKSISTNTAGIESGSAGIALRNFSPWNFFFVAPAVQTGNVLDHCLAENVGNAAVSLAAQAGLILDNQDNSIIKNSISRGNQGTGIAVACTNNPCLGQNCIVQKNKVSENTLFGILDVTGLTANKNVYVKNEASANGATPLTTNYFGLPLGTPFSLWNLTGGGFPTPALEFDNLNIY